MASLPEMPAVSSLSKYVTRVLGQNPSKFTLQGTNSYLVHHPQSTRMILIDTTGPSSSGPLPAASLSTYLASLRSLLIPHLPSDSVPKADPSAAAPESQPRRRRRYISDIILTHWHRDHTEAVNAVIGLLSDLRQEERQGGGGESLSPAVKVWKFPCATATSDRAWAAEKGRDDALETELAKLPEGAIEPAAEGGALCRTLQQGQRFRLTAADPPETRADEAADLGIEFEVAHTPGHTSDSACLLLHEITTSSSSPAARPIGLFTADTVLGHGTAVFASLSAYLISLSSLISLLEKAESSSQAGTSIPLFPGHGDVVQDGVSKIKEYRAHRLERERQVIEALKAAEDPKTATELVNQIYGSTIPESLIPAATHGCLLHLTKLLEEGHVDRIPSGDEEAAVAVEHEEMQIPPGWHDGWVVKVASL